MVDIPIAPLPRRAMNGVPTLRETPPRVRVIGAAFSRDPNSPTPPATWAARPAGTAKYDRTPERPIKRRRWFISDSIEEVGALSGIDGTSRAKFVSALLSIAYTDQAQPSAALCHLSRTRA